MGNEKSVLILLALDLGNIYAYILMHRCHVWCVLILFRNISKLSNLILSKIGIFLNVVYYFYYVAYFCGSI